MKRENRMQFRDLKAQYQHLKPEIDDAIERVMMSGSYIGGADVEELEEALADFVGVKHCVTCGNGTDALQLALMAWGIGPGDAVFVPDFTFFSSGEIVSTVGATPVFVDVDESTFNIDPAKLENAISYVETHSVLCPRVIVTVDLFGLPAAYDSISAICEAHDLLLLEDGAQGLGGSIKEQRACSFGDISTTSFFPAKPLGGYGDGGAVFTDDECAAKLIRSFAVHGKGLQKYDNVRIGMNSRLDSIQAAMLRVKLRAFEEYELQAASDVASWYCTQLDACGLEDEGIVAPIVPPGFVSSWAQFTLKLPAGLPREALREEMAAAGIPTMVYYPKPMHDQVAFRDRCVIPPDGCVVASRLCDRVLSLPMGPYMNEAEVINVCENLRSVIKRQGMK